MQFKGAQQRRESLYELALFHAWHVANWSRPEHKLPKWERVLSDFKRKGQKSKVTSAMQQQAEFYKISGMIGVPIKFRPAKSEKNAKASKKRKP